MTFGQVICLILMLVVGTIAVLQVVNLIRDVKARKIKKKEDPKK